MTGSGARSVLSPRPTGLPQQGKKEQNSSWSEAILFLYFKMDQSRFIEQLEDILRYWRRACAESSRFPISLLTGSTGVAANPRPD
jgi:hypothetical protein